MKPRNLYFILMPLLFGISLGVLADANKKADAVIAKMMQRYESTINVQHEALADCKTQRDQATVLSKALSGIDWTDYNRQTNNCYDHSKRLQKELAANNIASSIMINQDRTHAWLAVWVESTNGHFLSADKDWQILEVRDKNLNVICKK